MAARAAPRLRSPRDELVGLVVNGIVGGRRELRYDVQKGELVVR